MITLAQAKAWHPCSRGDDEAYSDARLESLFAGEPATWGRVASWDIPPGDVIWLATRPGAIPVFARRGLARAASKGLTGVEGFQAGLLRIQLVQDDEEESACRAHHREALSRAEGYRRIPEVGWYLAARAEAQAARWQARAASLWAASRAWELCTLGACSSGGMRWEDQVGYLLMVTDEA